MNIMAVATQRDYWTGLAICGGLLLLWVAYKRGLPGTAIALVVAGGVWAWRGERVQASAANVNDKLTVGMLFLGLILGAAIAFALPLKRRA